MASKKTKHIAHDELRVIRIDRQAILELIHEAISAREDELFDLLPNNDAIIHVAISKDFDDAILYAMDLSKPEPVDFTSIDAYVKSNLDQVTTDSLYKAGTKYVVMKRPTE